MKKKKLLIIIPAVLLVIILCGIIWYLTALTKVSKSTKEVTFVVESGTSTKTVIDNLAAAGLIKSRWATYIYVKLHKNTIQASTFILKPNMSTKEIINELSYGGSADTYRITFIEGMRLSEYVTQIAKTFGFKEEDIYNTLKDPSFLQNLITDYWFIDESILDEDLYFPLEGYIYPDTYEFYKNATITDVITKTLNQFANKLSNFKTQIEESKYSFHDILTMASIAEKEAINSVDRSQVAQVIYTRLNQNMALGMDVTSYYGVQKDLKQTLTKADVEATNPYNTRNENFKGLPVGPICSPSLDSIIAVLNPADTNYVYFFADVKTGEIHFTADYNEFLTFKEIYG